MEPRPAPEFSRLVLLACHDLRTPLATVNGFAKTLLRGDVLEDQNERFLELIAGAAEELNDLLDLLGLATRIEAGSYEPSLRTVDTRDLVAGDDARVAVEGAGEPLQTDEPALRRSLAALASAALRHGEIPAVTWTVQGRTLRLAPVNASAAAVVTGAQPKDLGSLVARLAIEDAGGTMTLDGESLVVRL